MVGKVERVPLREIWRHEAYDFTTWLQNNIDVLNDALGLSLSNPEKEQPAGDFSVDLLAEDEAGNAVVIENQLGASDHAHLGKLVTYLTAIGGKTAIWIVADPRAEHINAMSWLNETSANFYLVKVEGIKIGDSDSAPLLTVIVKPSKESHEIGETKKELADRYNIRQQFWKELLAKANQVTRLHANISPSQYSWIGSTAGHPGLSYNYNIARHDARIELYIDYGKGEDDKNKAVFDEIASHKQEIEESFGDTLIWDKVEGRRSCNISKRLEIGGYRDEEKWPQIQDAMISNMVKLEKAIHPFIKRRSM